MCQILTLLVFVITLFAMFISIIIPFKFPKSTQKISFDFGQVVLNRDSELIDSKLFCYIIANIITEISTEHSS